MTYPAKYPTLNETTLTPEARAILKRIIKTAFPHPDFPDEAYERMTSRIVTEADASTWFRVVLTQGLIALGAQSEEPFLDLTDERALAVLRRVADLEFFGFIRRTTVLNLYDDPQVWEVLGYEGPSFDKGGYLHRGFADLDWLPTPRIEAPDGFVPDTGPLPYPVLQPGQSGTAGTGAGGSETTAGNADSAPDRDAAAGSAAARAAGPAPESGTGAQASQQRGGGSK
ncbi:MULTISPECIES: hypothetical protein [Arthrobacter]|uniref:hypothetical protein n=1 Tax=Arthrobacter TaxID=1663 RepID=UPI0015E24FA4|nr:MULTISPECIES: hypothetical protein [Arthrobacter]MBO0896168.1 hypothetical protein [Arthrobacter sunyaminii]